MALLLLLLWARRWIVATAHKEGWVPWLPTRSLCQPTTLSPAAAVTAPLLLLPALPRVLMLVVVLALWRSLHCVQRQAALYPPRAQLLQVRTTPGPRC
jgi:hypothetical protein